MNKEIIGIIVTYNFDQNLKLNLNNIIDLVIIEPIITITITPNAGLKNQCSEQTGQVERPASQEANSLCGTGE